MLLVCCLCAAYMLFMRWLCAVCVLVARRKSWTKWGEIVSKPSRRHLGTISKECERKEIKKTIYNLAPRPLLSLGYRRTAFVGSPKARENYPLVFIAAKHQISNIKYQCSNLNVQCSKFNIICVFVMINGL